MSRQLPRPAGDGNALRHRVGRRGNPPYLSSRDTRERAMEGDGSLWMFILFKGFLGFVVPIALGLQQLISVKRLIRADREAEAAAAAATAPEAGAAPAPATGTARERVPEPA
jgi:hypothetical protein